MAAAIRILGLSGSLRSGSHNTALLRAAALSLPSGVELEVYDGLRDLPHYDADLDGELPVGQASGAFGEDGHLIEPDLRNALEELLGVLAARVGARESQAV